MKMAITKIQMNGDYKGKKQWSSVRLTENTPSNEQGTKRLKNCTEPQYIQDNF